MHFLDKKKIYALFHLQNAFVQQMINHPWSFGLNVFVKIHSETCFEQHYMLYTGPTCNEFHYYQYIIMNFFNLKKTKLQWVPLLTSSFPWIYFLVVSSTRCTFFAAKVSVKSIFRSRQVLYKTGSVWVVISGYVFDFTSGERPSTVIFIKKLNYIDLSLIRNDSVGV